VRRPNRSLIVRALRFDRFGPPAVLYVASVPVPEPGPGELSVRVAAAGLNPLDGKIREGQLRWLPLLARPPRGVGTDFAGTVEAVGPGVEGYAPGDRVFGSLSPLARQGSFAEVVVVRTDRIARIPPGVALETAAALPVAGGTAVQALTDDVALRAGQRVLVTGAAGGVGGAAVQYARHLGASVTGVCSGANADHVRALGAGAVVDYRTADWTRGTAGRDPDDPGTYDVILDAACATDFVRARRVLAPDGAYLSTLGRHAAVADLVRGRIAALGSRQRCIGIALRSGAPAWERLIGLAARGVIAPTITRTIRLEEVAAAQAAMATGHGRGKTLVVPTPGGP
jgi:NADPH:quinone reductase-like Zn-dependent oxidoreductase